LRFGLDEADQVAIVGDADVEIAIGREDDPVGPFLDEVLGGNIIRELDARSSVGRPAGTKSLDRVKDFRFLEARRRRKHHARGTGVYDDSNLIVLAELL